MVRVITQILVGLMLLFGAINLMAKALMQIRKKGLARALYFLILSAVALFFSIMAFYYAYSGLTK